MCGIAGIIGNGTDEQLDLMLSKQKHRGPDNKSKWITKKAKLGHNRLSIIDLSVTANQPFLSDDKRYVLVFNGEIYNYIELKALLVDYKFKTKSDTEVLLAAYIKWGKDCMHKLNGMFSFAIYDTQNQSLFAVRDRFGVKPFYYHQSKTTFYFSSEIKSIHAAGIKKNPNEKVWASYLTFGSYGMPNETFWQNIWQLPAGHCLTYQKGKLDINKWYFFEKEIQKYTKKENIESVKQKYASLLKDSIKLRFRADVTIGFNISGGLDSSVLLAFVNQIEDSKKIKAYTFYTNDKRYDELPWVEEMINLTNNPLVKVLLQSKDVENSLNFISSIQDEPFGGIPTIAYSKIFAQARKDNVLVLLDGQGMDEQWAGYDYYLKSEGTTIQGVNKSPFRPNVLTTDFLALAEKPLYPKPFDNKLLNMQYRDLFYTKIPRALRFNDRISMAYSTELREPFLDYRLVEYAFAQPLEYKIKKGIHKYLVRELAAEFLSDTITYAPKRPLQTPQREWLAVELKSSVEKSLSNLKQSKYSKWFNFEKLETEWQNYLKGDNNSSFHIWQWVNLSKLLAQ